MLSSSERQLCLHREPHPQSRREDSRAPTPTPLCMPPALLRTPLTLWLRGKSMGATKCFEETGR